MWKWFGRFATELWQTIINLLNSGTPTFDPEVWSPANDVQYENNCYNYACDIRGTYAQPGLASGHQYGIISCKEVGQAAIADGLVPIDCTNRCGKGAHKVALVIAPGNTFHWYRRDRDGRWSHKPGDGPPTNLDYSGNLIVDPRNADLGPFTFFCGCYCVNKRRISIK
jgi:hypothetical protein